MKYIYITLGLIITLNSYTYAQNKYTEQADKLYKSHQYVAAIEEYQALIKDNKADDFVYKRLADSYYHIFNMEKAVYYYKKISSANQSSETYYNYAQALKTQGKYDEAYKQMDKFASFSPNDYRAIAFRKNPDYIPTLQAKEKLFEIEETSLNLKGASDYGASFGENQTVYFVSTRNNSGKTDKWNGKPYLDIYQSTHNEGSFSQPQPVDELNSRYHDGPVTVSTDGKVLFFTRDGLSEGSFEKNKKANAKIGKLGIYRAEKKDGKWENIQPLPFNSTNYSVGNPSLSSDGKILYFASDMPGGIGDTDIWKVTVNNDGTYGKPVNLGNDINTEGKENFPYITKDNVLYFASNGRQGLGGYDLFMIDLTSANKAQNLGEPINSNKDDFAFTFNQNQEIGLFSSNRNGEDKIYFAFPICSREATIVVKDAKTQQPLPQAEVKLLDKENKNIQIAKTSADGTTVFSLACSEPYRIAVSSTDYKEQNLALLEDKNTAQTEVLLSPIEKDDVIITDKEVLLNPIYFEYDKSNITAQGASELDRLVKVMKNYPDMVILVKSHTDTQGNASYNLNLSEKRTQSTVQYVITQGISKDRISGKGMGEQAPKINCGDNCTDEENAQNRRSEFMIVKK